jgi:membrane protease YdiL (CAAX protease family)
MTPAWKFALVVLILLLVNAVPGLVVPPDIWLPWRVTSWMLTIAMLLLALAIVGTRMTRDWRGVLVDRRNVRVCRGCNLLCGRW